MRYVLSFDQGTTSSRAVLFDESGRAVCKAQHEFAQHYPNDGFVEHDPIDILASQGRAAKDCLEKSGVDAADIACIGIANQRETTIVWEKATGKPIYNAIVWQCRRTSKICEELSSRMLGEYITEKTGLLIDAYFSATKLKWLLDNVSGAKRRAEAGELLFGTVDAWLLWSLTGGTVHATDYTNASRTMLFDIEKLDYDDVLCRELGVPKCMLPSVYPSSHDFGTVAKSVPFFEAFEGIPICGVAGDQQASLFGQACFSPGDMKITYGTGCFLMMNTGGKRVRSKTKLLTTLACTDAQKPVYALEGSIFNAGSVINWLRDEVMLVKSAKEASALALSVKDAGGAVFVPAFTGLGAPYWDMYARGALLGITRGTTKAHIVRAAIESVGLQAYDLLTAMCADSGETLTSLKVDGGLCASDALMQFQADLISKSVLRPANVETTAFGAAALAGLAAGVYNGKTDIQNAWQCEREFLPCMDDAVKTKTCSLWQRAVARARGWIE